MPGHNDDTGIKALHQLYNYKNNNMKDNVMSFRTGDRLYTEILAECDRLGITKSEYILRIFRTAKFSRMKMNSICRRLKSVKWTMELYDDPTTAVKMLDEIIEWLEKNKHYDR